ncbi:MAG: hypothetical protein IIT65_04895, partial [Lachnospiraceae bacterium]|nr:hypothetical protein [Lachnospiraceae bacterium]
DIDSKTSAFFQYYEDDQYEQAIELGTELLKEKAKVSKDNEDYLNVLCRNTNTVIFKIQKLLKGDEKVFMFRVNIVTVDAELKIKQQFTTYEEFTNLINSTIQALKSFPSFEEYADELENYL